MPKNTITAQELVLHSYTDNGPAYALAKAPKTSPCSLIEVLDMLHVSMSMNLKRCVFQIGISRSKDFQINFLFFGIPDDENEPKTRKR